MDTPTTTSSSLTLEIPAAAPQDEPTRCQYHYSNGKRCRFPGSPSQSGFCSRHFRLADAFPQPPSDATDLSADLLPEPSEFSLAEDIRLFLARLLVQVTTGRISSRRAAVLAFITNQLLHSHRAIQKEAQADPQPQRVILDMPGPLRD